jgi:hypothetical protein
VNEQQWSQSSGGGNAYELRVSRELLTERE